jgi:hypothetical protein
MALWSQVERAFARVSTQVCSTTNVSILCPVASRYEPADIVYDTAQINLRYLIRVCPLLLTPRVPLTCMQMKFQFK